MLVKSAPDHFLFRGQVLSQHVASLGSRSKWHSSLRVVRFKSCIVYRIRQEWECQMYSLYAEACLFAFFVFRVVASLTGLGWARVPLSLFFPQILGNFSYFSSNCTYFLPHFDSPGGRLAHMGRSWLRHCLFCHIFNIQFLKIQHCMLICL